MTNNYIYTQDNFPIFQNRMYDTSLAGRNCPKGHIRLVQDVDTGLVRNIAFDQSLMKYDSSYQNEQGNSPQFHSHLESVAELIQEKMGKNNLVEVGCGKGTFLELMRAHGCSIMGYDPAYEGTNPNIRQKYFSDDLGISGSGLILRHVLEHIDDPVAFLFRLASANRNQGCVYIEVPCFDWICDNRAWYDIFYEHVNYFRLSDFHRIFGKIIYADRAFGGQYLRIIADLATIRIPERIASDPVVFPSQLVHRLKREVEDASGPCIVWGGASKGVIFSLLRERSGHPVSRVIDINPAKQGRFLPGTGLKVVSPKQGLKNISRDTVIYVMNINYLDEIKRMVGFDARFKGISDD